MMSTSKQDAVPLSYVPLDSTTTLDRVDSSSSVETTNTTSPIFPTFLIQTQGKQFFRLALPTSELRIPILDPATHEPLYISTRASRWSGDCTFTRADDSTNTSIASVTYRFGPGRSPSVRIGRAGDGEADVFEMNGKNLLTRSVTFTSRRWGDFEWRYASRKERAAFNADNLLVLEKAIKTTAGERKVRLAQLVRNKDARTPGTSSWTAGSGGSLDMSIKNESGDREVDEVTVLVTCLVMLKKEVDRRRMAQASAAGGAGSGG